MEVTESCPTPGQNTGVGSLSLLQGIFPIQGSNPGLPHCRLILYQLSHKESPRILEWVAYPFSRGSSQPRNRTRVFYIADGFFTNWAIREAHLSDALSSNIPRTITIWSNANGYFQSLVHSIWATNISWIDGYTMNIFSSVTQSCPTLCNLMDCSMPGLPVYHQLPEFTQTHFHWVGDAIQPSHPVIPLSSCPQSFPASGSFQMSQFFASGGPNIGVSTSTSVHPTLM